MNKRVISFIIFLFIILNVFTLTSINATEINTDTDDINGNSFIVDSDGNYYVFYMNTTEYKFAKSINDGVTWSNTKLFDVTDANNKTMQVVIDSNDIAHLLYWRDGTDDLCYRTYNTNTEILSIETILDSSANLIKYEIGVNRYNDVIVAWDEVTTDLFYKIKTYQIGVWSATNTLNASSDDSPIGIDSDTNGDFYILAHRTNGDDDILLYKYDVSTTVVTTKYVEKDMIAGINNIDGDLAIDNNNNFYMTWVNTTGAGDDVIYYGYSSDYNTFLVEQLYNIVGIHQINPSISVDSTNTVYIIWRGQNPLISNTAILGYNGSFGDWGNLNYYGYSDTDDMNNPCLMYQNYPTNLMLEEGLLGCYINETDDNLEFFYDGTQILYDDSAGQQQGDLDQYNQRCTGALLYNEQIYTSNISNYINSIGDITLRGLELYVNDNQIDIVTDDRTDYTGWINGVNIGNPNYIFQNSPTQYKLQWVGLNVNVGENDIILEFQNAQQGIFAYWWHMPLGYTDTAKYGGTAGDGYFDGTLFDGYLGLGTCVYYDVNVPTESDNTYDITLLSNDPHWKGNLTEVQVTVLGNASWLWLIQDPNGNTQALNEYQHGNNVFYIANIVESNWITGEYVFYALDQDAYPNGLSVSDNITFNVTVYGGETDKWFVDVRHKPIELNLWQTVTFYVPDNEKYALWWQHDETYYWEYLGVGVGDGEIHTLIGAFQCYDIGQWSVWLTNRSDPNPENWDDYGITFQCFNQTQQYILVSHQILCNVDRALISGYYDGESGTLVVYKDENNFKSYPNIETGEFSRWFYPDDDKDALGIYEVYLKNSMGNPLQWSRLYNIEVIDCGGTIPTDPDFVPMYRGNAVMGGILTLTLIIILMLLPYGFMMALSKAGQTVAIPALVPIGFGCVGFIFSSAMQFINPMYLVAFIVIIVIFGLITMYGKFVKTEG